MIFACALAACGKKDGPVRGAPPTFSGDIAKILHENCAVCHHEGASGPFDLLTYDDAKKRSRQIAEVTATRYMPPWLPEEGYGHFEGERRLTEEQIVLLGRWHEAGAPLGDAAAVPAPPEFAKGWHLGEPDLIVELSEAYQLPAEGSDIYRNFVVPTGLDSARFVRGMEFRPGHPKAVHHAFVMVDDTGGTRGIDEKDPGPGFGGMSTGAFARSPGGHFISWQPGKVPSFVREGMSWRLPAKSDFVLQLHMQTLGKEVGVKPSVGLYFTDSPPKRIPYKVVLTTDNIDIPPGAKSHTIGTKYELPVDAEVLGLIPHAHYLGKRLHGYAMLPDGTEKWLVRIDHWDFNWQGDYRLSEPLFLPAGSVLYQEFSYDNSADNPLNPNDPPKRVVWGQNTTDEMAELWVQLLTSGPEDTRKLNRHYSIYSAKKRQRQLVARQAKEGDSAEIQIELAKTAMILGDTGTAETHLKAAKVADPKGAEPYYMSGRLKVDKNPLAAIADFEAAVERDPSHLAALNGLGMMALRASDLDTAQMRFEQAVAANPESSAAQGNLGLVYLRRGNARLAIPVLEKAQAIDPENPKWKALLQQARGR